MIPVHAVITTHNRPDDLRDCVAAISPQVHHVIVIDNASEPPVPASDDYAVIHDPEQPPNLSRLWNIGIEGSAGWAAWNRAPEWDTLVINDDFVAGPGFVDGLQSAMRDNGAVLASPFAFGNIPHARRVDLYSEVGTLRGLHTRMAGFAWMTRGEARLRVNESTRWWYGDDDVAQRACAHSSRAVVHGLSWAHRRPDQSTSTRPELSAQAGRDREAFVREWGFQPW